MKIRKGSQRAAFFCIWGQLFTKNIVSHFASFNDFYYLKIIQSFNCRIMTFQRTLYILVTLLFSVSLGYAEDEPRSLGTSFKLSKSIIPVPYRPAYIEMENANPQMLDIVNGTFGLAFELLYKAKRRTFYSFALEYNFISFKDENIQDFTGEDLYVNYTSVQIGGITYLKNPDRFTPYFGYGVDIMFFSSNQDKVFKYKQYYKERQALDYFGDVNVALMLKAGLTYPLEPNISLIAEFDVRISSSEYLGVIPKLNLGATYWIK